jgi:hypothetical protein
MELVLPEHWYHVTVVYQRYVKEGIIVNDQREEQSHEAASSEPQTREVTFAPDYTTTFPTYYANFAFVNHTPYDFDIDFSFIAPPHRVNESQGIVSLPIIARVTIPNELVQGLINALNIQLTSQRQEREQGRAGMTGARREVDSHG